VSSAGALAGWIGAGCAIATVLIAWRWMGSRREAVARACHELRGPITAARLGLSLGSRGGELSADRLRAIDTELGRASLALDDLTRGRGGAPRMGELERVDLQRLLAESAEAWSASASAAGVQLSNRWIGSERAVWGDRLRLAQAVGNLIANAIEHGGETVEVLGCLRGSVTRIEIIDDGPGLRAPISTLIRGARRGRGARGRGLAIVHAIVAAHGGCLAAAPSPAGARVVLELPTRGSVR
jgi:signal transduction histidine kinase